jgi:hypothetical protein
LLTRGEQVTAGRVDPAGQVVPVTAAGSVTAAGAGMKGPEPGPASGSASAVRGLSGS